MKILVLNGPNLNMLGIREPGIYGSETYRDLLEKIAAHAQTRGVSVDFFQSNHEGAIIDEIQRVGFTSQGIAINAGAYTHYSIAIADALRAVTAPAVEVHISDVMSREPFRHVSMIKDACATVVAGYGLDSYRRAIDFLLNLSSKQPK